jgi:hypothetical protein
VTVDDLDVSVAAGRRGEVVPGPGLGFGRGHRCVPGPAGAVHGQRDEGGGGGGSACAPDTLGGAVTLTGNTTGVVLAGNTIGGAVSLTRNTTEVVVAGNTISGSLSCNGNDPAPADNGQLNTVTGLASGQCSALA